MSTKTQLQDLLIRLEQNRSNVPLELLKTKYKAGYELLLNQIKITSEQYIHEQLGYLLIHRSIQTEADRVLLLAVTNSEYRKKISQSLYIKRDFDEFEQIINELLRFLTTTLENHFSDFQWIEYLDSEMRFVRRNAEMAG